MVIYLCFYRGKIRILILNPNLNTYIKGPKSYIIIDTMFIIQPLLSANSNQSICNISILSIIRHKTSLINCCRNLLLNLT